MGFINRAQRFTGSNYLDVNSPFKTDITQERRSNKIFLMEINKYKCINVQTLQSQVQDSGENEKTHEET